MSQLEILIKGVLKKETLLDIIRNFIVFETDKKIDPVTGLSQIETIKKLAAYHQYYAVNKAVESTRLASGKKGNRKAGVIWHTQGSGKSLTMVFYTGKLIHSLDNPTIVVITDRNDLDQQLFDTFSATYQLLLQGQEPKKATDRDNLKTLLKVASGGIVFTTIQKFFPEDEGNVYDRLSNRTNIVVIADEAHRTQYGFKAKLVDTKDSSGKTTGKRIAYGFAKYLRDALPNATFIGFTGTPIENTDINTPEVFGNYIDIYDIGQAIDDGATVKIFYESRMAKISLTEEGRKLIEEFDEEFKDDNTRETRESKAKWTKLEAIIGHPRRLENLAGDIIIHYETRSKLFEGKAMIVTMSRRIAIALYDEIIKLRPDWHSENRDKGQIKIVMTSNSSEKMEFDPEDPESLIIPACHRTNKTDRIQLAKRMKDPEDPLKIVIVRDMWLTGFDVPCLHTIYVDKPMKSHSLIQAISRVNRVYNDKPGGVVVDYIGIGTPLKSAVKFYSNTSISRSSEENRDPVEMKIKPVDLLKEKMEVVQQMFHTFDYGIFFTGTTSQRLSIILQAEDFILGKEDLKERFIRETTYLSRLAALSGTDESALVYRDEIAFFEALKVRLLKFESDSEILDKKRNETVIRRIVTEAVESTEVLDIFGAAGLEKPEISLLSEEFLQEVKEMKHKNLSFELLRKILEDEIRIRQKTNITEGKNLLDMLERSIKKYRNNLVTTIEVIEELLGIAEEIRNRDSMAERLKLSPDEWAFYSALGVNDSAVKVMGDEVLTKIAREIADKVRNNTSIDWARKESARAKLMVIVKRVLNYYGYPPDKQKAAVDQVMNQAKKMADYWVENL